MGYAARLALLALTALLPLLPSASHAKPAVSDRRYAVILVLDGARPQYLQPSTMPNLRWLLAHGVAYTRAFAGQEIGNTPLSHATIGTGVFPSRHGVQGFEWKDPRTGAVTRPTDRTPVQSGALEAVLTAHNAPSIAAQVKATTARDTILSVSGHKCYASDAMGTASADVILCAEIYHDRWVAPAVGRHRQPPGAINNARWDVPIPPPHSGFGPFIRSDLSYRVRQAYSMLMATDASADGPEVFAVYSPHVTTGDRISNGYHWLGGHLGPGWDDQHIPFVLAGAGVKHGVLSTYPARLVDIAPTLERVLALHASPSDGIVLADALRAPDTYAAAKQRTVGARLRPVVRALEVRSLDR